MSAYRPRNLRSESSSNVPALVVSATGVAIACLSVWYLLVFRAALLPGASGGLSAALVLGILEVGLLVGFPLVLVYGGYWLARTTFEGRRLWWAGLWTLIGLSGFVTVVALATSLQVVRGGRIVGATLVQAMLLAAGSGAVAGLLIGVSSVRETAEAERARRQRDALVFVNELLRHNVLNGMQLIKGNVQILEEHVDDADHGYVETTQERSDSIVELIQNVRVLVDSISREGSLHEVDLRRCLTGAVEDARGAYPHAEFDVDLPGDARVRADDLLASVFENLLTNAVEHNDGDRPQVGVTATLDGEIARVRVADDGPGIPVSRRERCFEAGEQDTSSVGQGLGLYLVATLVDRYGGEVRIEDADLGGATVVVELERADV